MRKKRRKDIRENKFKKRFISFVLKALLCGVLFLGIAISSNYSALPKQYIKKVLTTSTDITGIKNQAAETAMKYYNSYKNKD